MGIRPSVLFSHDEGERLQNNDQGSNNGSAPRVFKIVPAARFMILSLHVGNPQVICFKTVLRRGEARYIQIYLMTFEKTMDPPIQSFGMDPSNQNNVHVRKCSCTK